MKRVNKTTAGLLLGGVLCVVGIAAAQAFAVGNDAAASTDGDQLAFFQPDANGPGSPPEPGGRPAPGGPGGRPGPGGPGGFPGGPPHGDHGGEGAQHPFPGGPGDPLRRMGPPPGQVLPPFMRDALDLTPEQIEQLNQLQRDIDARLAEILTAEQREQLQRHPGPAGPGQPGGFGPGGPGGSGQPEGFGPGGRGPGGPPMGQGGPGRFGPPDGGPNGPGRGPGQPPQGGPPEGQPQRPEGESP